MPGRCTVCNTGLMGIPARKEKKKVLFHKFSNDLLLAEAASNQTKLSWCHITFTVWKPVRILVVINLAPVNAVVAKLLLIAVLSVRQPIGLFIKIPAMDACARLEWPISTRRQAFIENTIGHKHFVTVNLHYQYLRN